MDIFAKIIYVTALLYVVSSSGLPFLKTKYFKMERYEPCSNDSDLDLSVRNVTLMFNKNNLHFGGSAQAKVTIQGPWQFDIVLIRCKSLNNDCQTFLNNTYERMCDILYETKYLGTNFMKRITPTVKCPLKKGLYNLNDAEINLDFLSVLPIEGFFWHVIATFYKEDATSEGRRMFACISGYVRVLQSGSKRRRT